MKFKVIEKKALIKRETWGHTYSNQIIKDFRFYLCLIHTSH